jgi:transposase
MERPCHHRTSFRLDIRELDHLGPLLGLVGDELAKIGGRAHKHRNATLSETPLWLGIGEKGACLIAVEAVVAFFEALGFAVKRIGLEAGPLSHWLHAGLKEAGFETVLLETRHVKAALSAMTVKTDRKDARGLAQLLRMGWFQQVHAKSMASQEVRALLVGRKQLLGRLIDVELSIRGILRGFGLKVGAVTRKGFEARIRELVTAGNFEGAVRETAQLCLRLFVKTWSADG